MSVEGMVGVVDMPARYPSPLAAERMMGWSLRLGIGTGRKAD